MQTNRPKFTVERRGNGHRQKTAMPKWSHQKDLESLIGKEVALTFIDRHCDAVSGMLTNTDAYVIQLARDDKSVMTYYKHSIQSYKAVTA